MTLRKFRESIGVSLSVAAREIKIGKASLSDIERMLQKPRYDTVARIENWAWKYVSNPGIDWSWTSRPLKAARRRK